MPSGNRGLKMTRRGSRAKQRVAGAGADTLAGVRVRWIGRSLGLLVALAIAAAVVVLVPAKLIGWSSGDDPLGSTYGYTLIALPLSWPLYMTVLTLVAPRVRRPRRWAIALSPLLGLWFAVLSIFAVGFPDFYAAWLLWLSYGALVPLPPGTGAHAG
jgi:hypothetical protein